MFGVAGAQRQLGPQGLREGLERDPAVLAHQCKRLVQQPHRVVHPATEQQRAAEDRERPGRLANVAATARGGHRFLEQADRRSVVRPVGQRLAADPEYGRTLLAVLRQCAGPQQPPPCRNAAAGLYRDPTELAAHLARHRTVAARFRERQGLVKHSGALLVTAAEKMDERGAERCQGSPEQCGIADAARLRTRLAQTRDTRLDSTGVDGRPARLQLTKGRGPVADGGPALRTTVGHRPAHARIGGTPKLAAEQALTRIGVLARSDHVARTGEAAHHQLVGGVVEPVQGERP